MLQAERRGARYVHWFVSELIKEETGVRGESNSPMAPVNAQWLKVFVPVLSSLIGLMLKTVCSTCSKAP